MNPLKRFCLLLAAAFIAAIIYWSLVSSRQPETSSSNDSPLQADDHPAAEIVSSPATDGPSPSDSTSPSDKDTPDRPKLDTASLQAARAASLLSRTPKGTWSDRSPALEDYVADIPVAHTPALADFRALFPDLDPTDVQHFAQATMRQRATYGDTLDEDEATRFTTWLEPMERMQLAAAVARAKLVGVVLNGSEPMDLEGSIRSFSLIGFEGTMPCYTCTDNAAAAESTGANLVRLTSSYDPQISPPADGTGLYVNVNDHGTIYEHTEFQLPNNGGSRIVYKEFNDGGNRSHMTHVTGTVGAWGYNSGLMGMAPRVWIRSHIFQYTTDITEFGMMWPGQKHTTTNPRNGETEMKSVMSTCSLGSTSIGGSYDSGTASFDSTLRDYPYFIQFYSAGNEGEQGYNTLGNGGRMAKNVVALGAVSDTVRDDSGAYVSGGGITSWSARGPVLDGRIKPDLTANGTGLVSTDDLTGSSSKNGTSMSTPNAAGSTALLIDYINRKLPGHFFRSSTLRALLINTATDRGNAGPDYIYGYGIINVKAAADIVKRYAENPSTRVLLEDTLSSGQTWTQTYTYDGNGPIRLTLAWIDPAGAGQSSTSTDRSPRLVNNLNVRLIGPGNTTYQPFVMPFTTGNGTYAAYDANLYGTPAVTGDNFTDPHEQILVANPPAGTYTVQVTHSGSLQYNNAQPFSIAITGLSGATPLAPALASISPTTGNASNNFTITCNGSNFVIGSDVFLRRAAANGSTEEVKGYGVIPVSNSIIARFDTATLTKGYWDVVVRAPDGTESILKDAFLLPKSSGTGTNITLYTNNFESGATGLTLGTGWAVADPNKGSVSGPADAQQGTNALVTYPGSQYAGNVTTYATLPSVSTINCTSIKLEMQRWLGVIRQGSSTDYARVQYSLNGTSWTEVTSHSNLIETNWAAQTYSLPVGAENKSLVYLRFSLETDASNHSFGWNIDDLKITGVSSTLSPPRITSTAITNATQGQAYSYAITTTDSDTAGASLVFAATGLPAGLTLNPNGSGGATLSGTPTVSGTFSVSLSVSDGSYTSYQNFSLVVFPPGGNTAPVITTSTLPDAAIGTAYSANIAATDANGHPITLSLASPKPAWLGFTDNGNGTATLSGTPTAGWNGTFSLKFSAFDGYQTTTKTLTLIVRLRATIGFSAATASVNEAGGSISLTVTRADGNYGPVSVSYASANGTASSADYTAVSGTLSWNDGDQSSRTIVVPILQDTLSETSETFTVTLSSLTGIASFGTSVATVTIVDDENNALVSVAATDASCAEDTNDGTFTITRTGPTAASMTVNYSLSGTATNGTDYALRNGSVTIAAGSATATVLIDVTTDGEYEGDESVTLTIDPAIGYNVGDPASAEIIIVENDKPTVSVSTPIATVGENIGDVIYTFSRTGNTNLGPLTVNFAISGTASVGADYEAIGSSVTIPFGESEVTITIPILNDTLIEAPETLIVAPSSNAAYNIASAPNNSATVTIRDDTEPVVLVMGTSDSTASEPAKGDGSGAFRITRSGSPAAELTVNLTPPTGSATNGADYSTLPTSITFPAGDSTVDIPLVVIDDSVAELDETVTLGLASGTGYTVGTTITASINLYDDEPVQVRLEVSDGKSIEQATPDNGAFLFRRLGNRSSAVTITYSIAGTATNGTDYTTVSGTASIGSNGGSTTVTIAPLNDDLVEGSESVVLTISSVSLGTVASAPNNTATLWIRDDETSDVTVAVQDSVCAEGSTPDTGSFRISRTGATTNDLVVNYTLGGVANNSTDYASLSGTVTIPSGSGSVDVIVTPANDSLIEGAESVILTLSLNGAAYDIGDGNAATLWVRDDDAPAITLTAPDASSAEPEDGITDNGQWLFTASSAPASDLTLNYSVSGGSNGMDYVYLPGTLVLPAGQTTVTLDLVPSDDELNEGAETIALTLQQGSGYSVGTTSAVNVVIAESDIPEIRVYASRAAAAENPAVTGEFRFESDKILTANTNILYFMSGSATNGTDYTNLSGSIQMNSGANTAALTLAPTNDSLSEGSETAILTITDAAAYFVPGERTATVSIADDEADGSRNLVVTPLDLTIAENNTATFTVALDTAPESDLSVSVAHASGDTDLSVQSGASLTFTPTNWSTPQTVTLAAAIDADAIAGTAAFSISAAGHPTIILNATEADAEALPVITLISPEMSPLAVPDLGVSLEIIAAATDTIGTPGIAWSQVSGPASAVFANAAVGSTSVTFPSAGTYVLRATATDHQAQTASLDVTIFAGSSGAVFTPTTLGATNYAGSASVGHGTVTIAGTGGDLTGSAESGYYLTTPISGDFSVTARVASLTAKETGFTLNSAAKVGIVARETLASGSRMACETMRADKASMYLYRSSPNASLSNSTNTALLLPYFIRLDRVGSSLRAYRSADGVTWTQQGSSQTITMTNPVQLGFAAVSGKLNASQPLAVFDNITGLPAANGAPQINPGAAPAPAAIASVAVQLAGVVTDDALPAGNELSTVWTVRSAPSGGQVNFADANAPTTNATFSTAGTYVIRLTATDGPATVFEELTVNVVPFGTDITPPTLVSMVDDKGGSSVEVGTAVNYTVTFSEDIHAASVSAADFGNAGTASISIGTITEPTPGTFLVPVTASSAGSLQFRINANAVISDVAGNPLNTTSALLDDTTISVTSPYTTPVVNAGANQTVSLQSVTGPAQMILAATDPIQGIKNTAVGGNSTDGVPVTDWPTAESPPMAIDGSVDTKYLNKAKVGSGFYITPAAGATTLTGVKIYTANDASGRDPLTISIEGSNGGDLKQGSSWTLIQDNINLGINTDPGRKVAGPLVAVTASNTYTSYRIIVKSQRSTAENSVQYSELQLFGSTGSATTVNLNGSATDVDGDALTTTWSLVSKNPVTAANPTFGNAAQPVTTAAFTEAGTYVLRLSANDGSTTVNDEVTITIAPPLPAKYATWSGGTFANPFTDTALTSNPDGDSMNNLMEFAFGTDPTLSSEGPLAIDGSSHGSPVLKKSGGTFEFYFVRRKDHGTSGSVSYTPQFSNNLTSFTNSPDTPTWVANSASDPTHYEVVKVPFPNGTKFGRVEIVAVP